MEKERHLLKGVCQCRHFCDLFATTLEDDNTLSLQTISVISPIFSLRNRVVLRSLALGEALPADYVYLHPSREWLRGQSKPVAATPITGNTAKAPAFSSFTSPCSSNMPVGRARRAEMVEREVQGGNMCIKGCNECAMKGGGAELVVNRRHLQESLTIEGGAV